MLLVRDARLVSAPGWSVIKRFAEAFGAVSPVGTRATLMRDLRTREASVDVHLQHGIAQFDARWPDTEPPDDAPVFLFSAGWRSGSTFLQRLCMSSGDRLMWGEPYDHCGLIQSMAERLRPFTESWPADKRMLGNTTDEELVTSFVATLYPDPSDFRAAHRALFDRMFVEPARRRGFTKWGLKEIRLGSEHAAYLRWLYPKAKFVFLVRNPVDAWRSYRPYRNWYWHWPTDIVGSPRSFARHWRIAAADFVANAGHVDGLLVRYEDLRTPATIERLERILGHSIQPPATLPRVGRASRFKETIPKLEAMIIRSEVGRVARELGYFGES